MNKGSTIEIIKQKITVIEESKHDYNVPTSDIHVTPHGDELCVPGLNQNFLISEIAHSQIADKTGIPRGYYNKCRANDRKMQTSILAQNVNTWFLDEPKNRFIRTLGTNLRAFLGDKYKPIDNILIAKFIIPYLEAAPGITIKSAELTPSRLYIQAVTNQLQEEVRTGDVVQAGITISNSEVGLGKVKVESLLYFLRCLNGMTTTTLTSRVHLGGRTGGEGDFNEWISDSTRRLEDEALISGMKDMIENTLTNEDAFLKQIDKLRDATREKIVDVPKIVEVTKRLYSFTDKEEEDIKARIYGSSDYSKYGLSAAVTNLANDLENYDRSIDLQRIGGKIIDIPSKTWETWNTEEQVNN